MGGRRLLCFVGPSLDISDSVCWITEGVHVSVAVKCLCVSVCGCEGYEACQVPCWVGVCCVHRCLVGSSGRPMQFCEVSNLKSVRFKGKVIR